MEVTIDKQGRIVIPKKIRKKYGLSEESTLELVPREDVMELIPLVDESDLTVLSLRQPCETGDSKAHDKAFSRERAWTR